MPRTCPPNYWDAYPFIPCIFLDSPDSSKISRRWHLCEKCPGKASWHPKAPEAPRQYQLLTSIYLCFSPVWNKTKELDSPVHRPSEYAVAVTTGNRGFMIVLHFCAHLNTILIHLSSFMPPVLLLIFPHSTYEIKRRVWFFLGGEREGRLELWECVGKPKMLWAALPALSSQDSKRLVLLLSPDVPSTQQDKLPIQLISLWAKTAESHLSST